MVDADAFTPVETDCPSKAGTPAAMGISQRAGRPMDGRGMGVGSHVLGVGTRMSLNIIGYPTMRSTAIA